MSQLHEVIYVSRRAEGVTDEIIVDDIVLPAGSKNRRLDITGCLWFSEDRFLQLLEGPRQAVEDVYSAIEKDDRHTDIQLLSSTPLAARSFSRWNMRALSGGGRHEIDDLIRKYVPVRQLETKPLRQSSEPVLAQVRSYLVRLAQVQSVAD